MSSHKKVMHRYTLARLYTNMLQSRYSQGIINGYQNMKYTSIEEMNGNAMEFKKEEDKYFQKKFEKSLGGHIGRTDYENSILIPDEAISPNPFK